MTYRPTKAQIEAAKMLAGPASNVLLRGGSRSGKTFKIVDYMVTVAKCFPRSRQLAARKTTISVRQSIGFDTLPTVLRLCHSDFGVRHNKTDNVFIFENGSEIWLAGLDDEERVDKILGKEYCTIFVNECSEVAWKTIQTLRSRLAQNVLGLRNKFICDCNPTVRSHWSNRLFIEKKDPDSPLVPIKKPENYVSMRINPVDNAENLPDSYFDDILDQYSGRFRQRFVDGEYQDENENALWRPSMIDPYRVGEIPNDLDRIVIGVDPAVTANEGSDETGIIIAGAKKIGKDVHFYVLDDWTLRAPVKTWAARVVQAARKFKANFIIAETNNGGDTVCFAIRNMMDETISARVPVIKEHAKQGKLVRAEPVSLLYAKGLVHHVGEFQLLENQLCEYTGALGEDFPDRLDALVYAILYLSKPAAKIVVGHYSG